MVLYLLPVPLLEPDYSSAAEHLSNFSIFPSTGRIELILKSELVKVASSKLSSTGVLFLSRFLPGRRAFFHRTAVGIGYSNFAPGVTAKYWTDGENLGCNVVPISKDSKKNMLKVPITSDLKNLWSDLEDFQSLSPVWNIADSKSVGRPRQHPRLLLALIRSISRLQNLWLLLLSSLYYS